MNQGVPYNKAPLSFMLNNKLFYQEVVYTKIIQIGRVKIFSHFSLQALA